MAKIYDDFQITNFNISDTAFYKGQLNNNNAQEFINRLIVTYTKRISFSYPIVFVYSQKTSKNDTNLCPYIYIEGYRKNHKELIKNLIIEEYSKDRKKYLTSKFSSLFADKTIPADMAELAEENIKAYEFMIYSRFIQSDELYVSNRIGLIINSLQTTETENTFSYKNKVGSLSLSSILLEEENLGNAPRELLNFVFLYWKTTKKGIRFQDYLCGLCVEDYGKKLGITVGGGDKEKLKFIYKVKKTSTRADYNKNFLGMTRNEQITLLNAFYNRNNKENSGGWLRSAQLTAREIINKRVFTAGAIYKYYSEDSDQYRSIYDAFVEKFKASDLLDDYLKTLNINKFFISDVIAVRNGSNCLSVLSKEINKITEMSELEFMNVVKLMDEYFKKGELIPISLKMFLTATRDPNYKEEVENIGSKVKIMNPPVNYSGNYDIDDLDYFVLGLIKKIQKTNNKVTLSTLLEANDKMQINYNSFVYNNFVTTRSYGGGSFSDTRYALRFTFEVKIKNKSRKYAFEIAKGSVKIRTVGSASSTGEGGVNTASLNYIMREIYSGQYRTQLRKLAAARVAAFDRHLIRLNLTQSQINKSGELKTLYTKFRNMMNEDKIINSSSYDNHKEVFDLFSIIYTTDSDDLKTLKLGCMNAYVSYLRSIARAAGRTVSGLPPENFVDMEKKAMAISSLPGRTTDANVIKESKEYETKTASSKSKKEKIKLKYTNVDSIISKNNLDIICGYELGMLLNNGNLNYVIKVNGATNSVSVNINLTEADKKKLILTEWGLISARGVLVFDDKRFENAKKIEDVLKNKIKMPALLKIGV